jgi:hypothetical protein
MAATTRNRTAKAGQGSKATRGDQTGDGKPVEDKLRAIHEAGHAVAMYRLGYTLGTVSIERTELGCRTKPGRKIEDVKRNAPDGRARLERHLMVLHAGSVAEQIHVPYVATTFSRIDHDDAHTMLQHQETDPSVLVTWCAYLWQRTYALLLDPRQWNLVTVTAKALLAFRTISGKDAMFLLKDQEEARTKTNGKASLVSGGSEVITPWHREWLRHAATAKRETVEVDLSPLLRDVLKGLSKRAWEGLELAEIRTAEELSRWSEYALRSIKKMGRKTTEEIVGAAGKAGIPLAPDGAPYPWTTGEERR